MFYKIRWFKQAREITQIYGTGRTPWKVDEIHVVFNRFTLDDVINFGKLHFVTKEVLETLRDNQFTGLGVCQRIVIETTEAYERRYQMRELPVYYLLAVEGIPGQNDIGITPDYQLIVSGDVLRAVSRINVCHVEIEELELIKFLRKKYRRV